MVFELLWKSYEGMKLGISIHDPKYTLGRKMVITLAIKIILRLILILFETRHRKIQFSFSVAQIQVQIQTLRPFEVSLPV